MCRCFTVAMTTTRPKPFLRPWAAPWKPPCASIRAAPGRSLPQKGACDLMAAIWLVDAGTGNLHSVYNALHTLGARITVTSRSAGDGNAGAKGVQGVVNRVQVAGAGIHQPDGCHKITGSLLWKGSARRGADRGARRLPGRGPGP